MTRFDSSIFALSLIEGSISPARGERLRTSPGVVNAVKTHIKNHSDTINKPTTTTSQAIAPPRPIPVQQDKLATNTAPIEPSRRSSTASSSYRNAPPGPLSATPDGGTLGDVGCSSSLCEPGEGSGNELMEDWVYSDDSSILCDVSKCQRHLTHVSAARLIGGAQSPITTKAFAAMDALAECNNSQMTVTDTGKILKSLLNELGMNLQEIVLDGNSLFRALAVLRYETECMASHVREECIDFMQRHMTSCLIYTLRLYDCNIIDYIANIKSDGVPGSTFELMIVEQMWNCKLCIYRCVEGKLHSFYGNPLNADYILAYLGNNCYSPVLVPIKPKQTVESPHKSTSPSSLIVDLNQNRLTRQSTPTVVVMLGDGNCLFRSISHQLYGTQSKYNTLRMQCVEHMRDHSNRFSQFYGDAFDEYLTTMKRDGKWGGELEIRAMEELVDRKIIVFTSNSEGRLIEIAPAYDEHQVATEVTPLTISYHGDKHYNSVVYPQRKLPLPPLDSKTILTFRTTAKNVTVPPATAVRKDACRSTNNSSEVEYTLNTDNSSSCQPRLAFDANVDDSQLSDTETPKKITRKDLQTDVHSSGESGDDVLTASRPVDNTRSKMLRSGTTKSPEVR